MILILKGLRALLSFASEMLNYHRVCDFDLVVPHKCFYQRNLHMKTITTIQTFALSVQNVRNALGRPAKLKSIPAWVSSDSAVATVAVHEDGYYCDVLPVTEGTTTITVTADGISKSFQVEVDASPATDFDLIAGEAILLP